MIPLNISTFDFSPSKIFLRLLIPLNIFIYEIIKIFIYEIIKIFIYEISLCSTLLSITLEQGQIS